MRMRISIPANSDHAPQSGFTLVELLVVVAIIGFVSAAVVLAMPDPRGRVIDDADRFAALVAAASDEAVTTARPMGVWVSPSGYGFLRRRAGDRKGTRSASSHYCADGMP